MLLAAGADPAAKNSKGRTPATIAREDSLRSLLDNQGGGNTYLTGTLQ